VPVTSLLGAWFCFWFCVFLCFFALFGVVFGVLVCFFRFVSCWSWQHTGLCIGPPPVYFCGHSTGTAYAWLNWSIKLNYNMLSNMLNDLAEAMKALDGKNGRKKKRRLRDNADLPNCLSRKISAVQSAQKSALSPDWILLLGGLQILRGAHQLSEESKALRERTLNDNSLLISVLGCSRWFHWWRVLSCSGFGFYCLVCGCGFCCFS